MIYEEKRNSSKRYIAFAIVLLAILFAPAFLEIQELVYDEGLYLAAIREMPQFPPLMRAQGDIVFGGYPLYPYLVKLLADLGISPISALRLIPCIALLILGGIIFLTAWKAKDSTAGIVGAAVLLINFLTIEKFTDGNPIQLGALGVFSAWMIWYALGIWRCQWKLAWILTFLMAGLTFYTIGFTGLFLIVFPMLFHRRPLIVWTKPRGKAFLIGFALFVLFVLLWGIPRWTALESSTWSRIAFHLQRPEKYLIHLLTFPFDAALRFMPWTLFVWAPFCPAIVQMDNNPMLSRYLRTLFLGTFVVLWLSPLTQSRDIFFMIPPLAVLVAINYWIVVRRYGWNLLKLFEFFAVVLLILCAAALCYFLIPQNILPEILTANIKQLNDTPFWLSGVICSALGVLLSIITIIMCASGARVWLTIIILSGAVILPYRGVVIPYQNLKKEKEEFGLAFRNAIPDGDVPDVVYRMYDIPPSYNEMHYFDIRLKTIESAEELPAEKTVVYVFSSVVPSAPDRIWQLVTYRFRRNIKIELWRGKLKTEDDYE